MKDLKLWPLKLHYLFQGAGGAPIIPFLPIIGRQMGIPGSGIGFILAFVQITGLVIKPFFGSIMDKYPSWKTKILQLMLLCAILSFSFLRNISPLETKDKNLEVIQCLPNIKLMPINNQFDPCLKHKLHTFYDYEQTCTLICEKSGKIEGTFAGSNVAIEDKHLILTLSTKYACIENDKCYLQCDKPELDQALNIQTHDKDSYIFNIKFWLILSFWVAGSASMSGVFAFQDAIANQCVQGHSSGETFGHQRLWASVGWGSSALLVGYLVDLASETKLQFDYGPAFNTMAVIWFLDILVVGKLPVSMNIFSFALLFYIML